MSAPNAGAGLATDFSTMDGAAGRVDDVNRRIDQLLRAVRGRVDELGGVWQGQAQLAFARIMTDWDVSSRELNEALSGIADTLRRNRTAFDTSEQDNLAAVSRAAGAGPLAL